MRLVSLGLGLALAWSSAAFADVHFAIDVQQDVRPISRFVYGVNGDFAGGYSNAALVRMGGNRWTAYNWENNASNAGTDWYNQNDSLLSDSDAPGEAVRSTIAAAQAHDAGVLVTIPINGYVAADKNGGGDVNQTPNYLQTRFEVSLPAKGAPFTLAPSAGDGFVYQDEFVNWVLHEFPGGADPAHPIYYPLDRARLWPSTHPRIHPNPTTYAELAQKTIDYATAIKNVSPDALVFGPVNYGWYGYVALQGAPDAAGRDFQAFWLAQVEAAQQLRGSRLVDVLDVHWYPEAQGGGVRITGTDTYGGGRRRAPPGAALALGSDLHRDELDRPGLLGRPDPAAAAAARQDRRERAGHPARGDRVQLRRRPAHLGRPRAGRRARHLRTRGRLRRHRVAARGRRVVHRGRLRDVPQLRRRERKLRRHVGARRDRRRRRHLGLRQRRTRATRSASSSWH